MKPVGTFRAATLLGVALTLSALLYRPVAAENWAQLRGPHHNGSSRATDLPENWSTTENVSWMAELPGAAAATPVIYGNRVFISSTDPQTDQLCAICLDRSSGTQLWRHDVASGIQRDTRSNFASPTPATDGERVVFFYASGDLVAFDFDGSVRWSRNLQEDYGTFAFLWTFGSSPIFHDGRFFLQVLQRDVAVDGRGFSDRTNDSYLLAIDPETGKTLWRHIRPSNARQESREAYSSPVPTEHNGRRELVVIGGDDISGHDPATGEELWRWGTWNPGRITHWRLVPSPVVGDGVVLACAPKRDPIYAVKLGGNGRLSDDWLAWTSDDEKEVSSDVPTPAFYDGDFFVLSDVRKSLTRVEPKSGKIKWSIRTPGTTKYEASPTAADGKIYLINQIGEVAVVRAESGEMLGVIPMDEAAEDAVRSTIVAVDDQLFVRVNRKLYCVAK